MNKKLIVLNFNSGNTHVFPFNEHVQDAEELIEKAHELYDVEEMSSNNCQWMVTSEPITHC